MTDHGINRLLDIMASLRDRDHGCPWDIEQTHESLVPYLIEEAFEAIESIEADDTLGLVDELGDVLFQIVFHARIAEEDQQFGFDDVVAAICDKLVRRHPHVFADQQALSIEQQSHQWRKLKDLERREADREPANYSLLADVSLALPAIPRSIKLQQRAASVGFDWRSVDEVLDKVHEELEELREVIDGQQAADRLEHEIGDLLMAVTNLARHAGIDPETALRSANRRFERRFGHIEAEAERAGVSVSSLSLAEMEALWQRAKELERQG